MRYRFEVHGIVVECDDPADALALIEATKVGAKVTALGKLVKKVAKEKKKGKAPHSTGKWTAVSKLKRNILALDRAILFLKRLLAIKKEPIGTNVLASYVFGKNSPSTVLTGVYNALRVGLHYKATDIASIQSVVRSKDGKRETFLLPGPKCKEALFKVKARRKFLVDELKRLEAKS